MRTRPRYIPLEEAEIGMVLGARLDVIRNGLLRLTLPEDHQLDEDNLYRLHMLQMEFICVVYRDRRTDEEVALDAALAARRTLDIFDGADLADPVMATLFDQVLVYRSA
jgi:hypothetical protein